MSFRWRHDFVGIFFEDARDHLGLVGFPGLDWDLKFASLGRSLIGVESKFGLAGLLVRPVAVKAFV